MDPRRGHRIGLLVGAALVVSAVTLAAAPAGAQRDESTRAAVVLIRTPQAAGTYTVSWETLGDCDPGPGTSGMAGQVTLTVQATGSRDDTPAPAELTGEAAEGVVVIRPFCFYKWQVTLVEATTGANCILGPAPFEPDENNEIAITLADPAAVCSQQSRIVVRINPATPIGADTTDHNAILTTPFGATARPVENAPRGCRPASAASRVADNDTTDTADDAVSIELRVVDRTASGRDCRYDVTLQLPGHLAATHGDRQDDIFENVDPLATIDFRVATTTRTIYLLQTVTGDAGGASVRYGMSRACGGPPIVPEALVPRPATGGIQEIEPVTMVELREGRFNITAALAEDPYAPGAFDGVATPTLDPQGAACEASISLSHLPPQCVTQATSQTIALTTAPEPVIVEFTINCGDHPRAHPHTTDITRTA